MARSSLSHSHSPGLGHECFWHNRLSGTDGSQNGGLTNALGAIEVKEKSFRAHWWGWRRDRLGPGSYRRPDRVNGSLIKSVLGRGTWGVLTYQPLQTCLSVPGRPRLLLGRPESGNQGPCWSGCQLERGGYWIHQSRWQGTWGGGRSSQGAGKTLHRTKL